MPNYRGLDPANKSRDVGQTSFDPTLCVIGGGLVGLSFALMCAEKNIPTALIEAKSPPTDSAALSARVSALNTRSLELLTQLGIWPLADTTRSGVFRSLQVWDSLTGAAIHFDSAEMGEPHLGFNVDNASLIQALWQRAEKHKSLRLLAPMQIERLIPADNEKLTAVLSNGELLEPDCFVGADGAQSWLREQVDIDCQPKAYGHHAVVTVVKTEKPHREQGWQVFLPDGPLALLPLADRYTSAVVWSMPQEQAEQVLTLSDQAVATKMNEAFGFRLGSIRLQLAAKAIPLTQRHAQSYSKPGVALIGDAAHTIHPLAGQGANLGFRDAQALSELMGIAYAKGRSLGSSTLLGRYERARRADNLLMLSAMQFFQKSFGSADAFMVQLRKMGMRGFNRSRSAKRACMQYALGQW